MITSTEQRAPGLNLTWGTTQQFWACRISHVLGLVAVLLLLLFLAS